MNDEEYIRIYEQLQEIRKHVREVRRGTSEADAPGDFAGSDLPYLEDAIVRMREARTNSRDVGMRCRLVLLEKEADRCRKAIHRLETIGK